MQGKERRNLGTLILTSLFPSIQTFAVQSSNSSAVAKPGPSAANNRSIVKKCKHCTARYRANNVLDEGFCSKECRAMNQWYMPGQMDHSSGIPIPVRKPRDAVSAAGPATWRAKSPVPRPSPEADLSDEHSSIFVEPPIPGEIAIAATSSNSGYLPQHHRTRLATSVKPVPSMTSPPTPRRKPHLKAIDENREGSDLLSSHPSFVHPPVPTPPTVPPNSSIRKVTHRTHRALGSQSDDFDHRRLVAGTWTERHSVEFEVGSALEAQENDDKNAPTRFALPSSCQPSVDINATRLTNPRVPIISVIPAMVAVAEWLFPPKLPPTPSQPVTVQQSLNKIRLRRQLQQQ